MKDRINSFEFASLIPFISTSIILGGSFLFLYNRVEKSSVISMFLGFILSGIFLLLIFTVFNCDTDKPLALKIKNIFPKWIYIILTVSIILLTFSTVSYVFYRLTSFFSTQFLTDTPSISISFVMGALVFYMATKNIEVITRFSSIAFVICASTFLFNLFTLFPQVKIYNLLPIIDTEIKNILLATVIFSIIVSGPSVMLLVVPKENISDPKNLKKTLIFFYIITFIMILLINIVTLGGLSIDVAKLYTYPAYIILKKIHVFDFINSIENIAILLWFFFYIIYCSLGFMLIKQKIAELFKIKNSSIKNIIIFLIIVLGIILQTMLFSHKSSLDKPNIIFYSVYTFLPLYLILLIYLIVYKIKKKKLFKQKI